MGNAVLALVRDLTDDTGGGGVPHPALVALGMMALIGLVMLAVLAFRRPR